MAQFVEYDLVCLSTWIFILRMYPNTESFERKNRYIAVPMKLATGSFPVKIFVKLWPDDLPKRQMHLIHPFAAP